MFITIKLESWMQEDLEFKVILRYIVNLKSILGYMRLAIKYK